MRDTDTGDTELMVHGRGAGLTGRPPTHILVYWGHRDCVTGLLICYVSPERFHHEGSFKCWNCHLIFRSLFLLITKCIDFPRITPSLVWRHRHMVLALDEKNYFFRSDCININMDLPLLSDACLVFLIVYCLLCILCICFFCICVFPKITQLLFYKISNLFW